MVDEITSTQFNFAEIADVSESILTLFVCSLWFVRLLELVRSLGKIATKIGLIEGRDKPQKSKTYEADYILPEECMADLILLHKRMLEDNLSLRERWIRLSTQVVSLLWAMHVQIRIENIFLPNKKHEIDD